MELDRISSLPHDVTEKIMSRLPIKDAVRTSILSTKWRYKSDMLQELEFDKECVSTRFSLVNVVDHVLLLHNGPLHKFKLSLRGEATTRDIDRWIFHLSKKPLIKELILDNYKGEDFNIPSSLFSFQDMIHLELYRCVLNPSSAFKGFGSLKTLDLWSVTMAQDLLEKLVGCSPLLETLKLRACAGYTHLNIHAPKLRFIYFCGAFQDFNLVDSSNLADASFYSEGPVVQTIGNLQCFCHHLPHIRRLTINRNFVQYLSIGGVPEKLPKPWLYLNFFSVGMNFNNPDEVSTVLCLLRSSPTLQELQILVDSEKGDAVVGEVEPCLYDNDYNDTYTQLRRVKLTKISCAKAQLDFIKFLLLNSPVLERMTLQPDSDDGVAKLLKDLLLFKRDSKHAEIVFLDP